MSNKVELIATSCVTCLKFTCNCEVKTAVMTKEIARSMVGNQPKWALRNMIKALEMFPLLNTAEDKRNLEAAKFLFKENN